MNKLYKRIAAFGLAFVVCFASVALVPGNEVPPVTSGSFGSQTGGAQWALEDGVITISGGAAQNPSSGNTFVALSAEQRNSVTAINISGAINASGGMSGTFGWFPNLGAINGLGYIDTSDVTQMIQMFHSATSLAALDLSGWNTAHGVSMWEMFTEANALRSITFGENFFASPWDANSLPARQWHSAQVPETVLSSVQLWSRMQAARAQAETWEWYAPQASGLFGGPGSAAWEFDGVDTITIAAGVAMNPGNAFGSLSATQRAAVTAINIEGTINAFQSMNSTFANFPNLRAINGLGNIAVAGVTSMQSTFGNSPAITELDLSGWDTANARQSMWGMFRQTSALSSITFGPDFVVSGSNSIPANNWRNTESGEVLHSAQLWVHLNTARTEAETWEWTDEEAPLRGFFGTSASEATWSVNEEGDTITITGGTAINPTIDAFAMLT